jgi:hypothetical protein
MYLASNPAHLVPYFCLVIVGTLNVLDCLRSYDYNLTYQAMNVSVIIETAKMTQPKIQGGYGVG